MDGGLALAAPGGRLSISDKGKPRQAARLSRTTSWANGTSEGFSRCLGGDVTTVVREKAKPAMDVSFPEMIRFPEATFTEGEDDKPTDSCS